MHVHMDVGERGILDNHKSQINLPSQGITDFFICCAKSLLFCNFRFWHKLI